MIVFESACIAVSSATVAAVFGVSDVITSVPVRTSAARAVAEPVTLASVVVPELPSPRKTLA